MPDPEGDQVLFRIDIPPPWCHVNPETMVMKEADGLFSDTTFSPGHIPKNPRCKCIAAKSDEIVTAVQAGTDHDLVPPKERERLPEMRCRKCWKIAADDQGSLKALPLQFTERPRHPLAQIFALLAE